MAHKKSKPKVQYGGGVIKMGQLPSRMIRTASDPVKKKPRPKKK